VRDKAAFKRGIKQLEALGHEVEVDADALASSQRFAGDDATRLAAIHRAAASGADVALISRGGYGLTRILPGIKYKTVAKAIAGGTKFVGLSDFTAFQLAMLAQTGSVTWAGPRAQRRLRCGQQKDRRARGRHHAGLLRGPAQRPGRGRGLADAQDWRAAQWQAPAQGLLCSRRSHLVGRQSGGAGVPAGHALLPAGRWRHSVHRRRGRAPLPDRAHADAAAAGGRAAKAKAIVFGQFTEFKLTTHDKGFKLQTVIDWLRMQLKRPVLQGLPFGHVPTKVLLPVGAQVSLSVEGRDALIYWGHV
jgi:muramoyltetrapeptide carboxypeptidase